MSKLKGSNPPAAPGAVIYCRTATQVQAPQPEPNSLESQEARCRAYAATRGYDVRAVFSERASGAASMSPTPQLKALMDYLGAHQDRALVVIAVNAARLSRDVVAHGRSSASIRKLGATIEFVDGGFDGGALISRAILFAGRRGVDSR